MFGIMIKKNILGLLFLLSALCLFNSCEDDPYYDDYGWATDALCNNTWVDFIPITKGTNANNGSTSITIIREKILQLSIIPTV